MRTGQSWVQHIILLNQSNYKVIQDIFDNIYIFVYTVGMKSIQYTVRNIPEPVDRTLRMRAKKQGRSFNQTVVEALKQATGVSEKPAKYGDLDWFIGSKRVDQKAFSHSQKWLDSLPNDMS